MDEPGILPGKTGGERRSGNGFAECRIPRRSGSSVAAQKSAGHGTARQERGSLAAGPRLSGKRAFAERSGSRPRFEGGTRGPEVQKADSSKGDRKMKCR